MDEQRKFHVLAMRNGSKYRVLAQNKNGFMPEVWHQIRITQRGATIQVYVNGVLDLEAGDETYSRESVALYCWGAERTRFKTSWC